VTYFGDRRGAYRVLVVELWGKNHSEDLGLDGRIILNVSSRSSLRGHGMDLCG
jgi:hypothetical protein